MHFISATVISGSYCHMWLIKITFFLLCFCFMTDWGRTSLVPVNKKQAEAVWLFRKHPALKLSFVTRFIFLAMFYGFCTPKNQDAHRRHHGGTPHLFGSRQIKRQPEGLDLQTSEKQFPPCPPLARPILLFDKCLNTLCPLTGRKGK